MRTCAPDKTSRALFRSPTVSMVDMDFKHGIRKLFQWYVWVRGPRTCPWKMSWHCRHAYLATCSRLSENLHVTRCLPLLSCGEFLPGPLSPGKLRHSTILYAEWQGLTPLCTASNAKMRRVRLRVQKWGQRSPPPATIPSFSCSHLYKKKNRSTWTTPAWCSATINVQGTENAFTGTRGQVRIVTFVPAVSLPKQFRSLRCSSVMLSSELQESSSPGLEPRAA
jgi:hypothetical protein